MNKIRVLIVDDSALVRQVLTEIISSDPALSVVGTASDPYIARDKIKLLNPDVLTLDVEMPKMDGLTFLSNLMRLHPMPVIMVSSLTDKGANETLNALALGAIDVVFKPKTDLNNTLQEYSEEIISKIKVAARANIRAIEKDLRSFSNEEETPVDTLISNNIDHAFVCSKKIIAIGASTGGTEAIKDVLVQLPADMPGIVITQHIPKYFSDAFAQRMNKLAKMTVREASDGEQILDGHVYVAPGDQHLIINGSPGHYICHLSNGPRVNRHKPSVDVLFRSISECAGSNAIGIILTGMGDDGAKGIKEMHEVGAYTIAQDEKSSVVWGMPGSAIQLGGIDHVAKLKHISGEILKLIADK